PVLSPAAVAASTSATAASGAAALGGGGRPRPTRTEGADDVEDPPDFPGAVREVASLCGCAAGELLSAACGLVRTYLTVLMMMASTMSTSTPPPSTSFSMSHGISPSGSAWGSAAKGAESAAPVAISG